MSSLYSKCTERLAWSKDAMLLCVQPVLRGGSRETGSEGPSRPAVGSTMKRSAPTSRDAVSARKIVPENCSFRFCAWARPLSIHESFRLCFCHLLEVSSQPVGARTVDKGSKGERLGSEPCYPTSDSTKISLKEQTRDKFF